MELVSDMRSKDQRWGGGQVGRVEGIPCGKVLGIGGSVLGIAVGNPLGSAVGRPGITGTAATGAPPSATVAAAPPSFAEGFGVPGVPGAAAPRGAAV